MSDLKSVLAFFIGLVFFVVLVVFVIGRVRMAATPKTSAQAPTITITLTPTPTIAGIKAKSPSLLDRIKGLFAAKPKATPTPKTTVNGGTSTNNGVQITEITGTPNGTLKLALKPTVILYTQQSKGGVKQPVVNTVSGVVTIPETGAETFVLPLASALGAIGVYLKKRK